jgi:hypothetical protein
MDSHLPFVGKNFTLSIENADGEFVEVRPIRVFRDKIVCLPIPGRDGIEYVPEWFGITHFG